MTTTDDEAPSATIDRIIAGLGDWRATTLGRVRELIHEAVPEVTEEIKWRKATNPDGVPTWTHGGIICTGETYKAKVKLTFPKGPELADPDGLFNANLDSGARRVIDLAEGDELDADAFRALIRAAAGRSAT